MLRSRTGFFFFFFPFASHLEYKCVPVNCAANSEWVSQGGKKKKKKHAAGRAWRHAHRHNTALVFDTCRPPRPFTRCSSRTNLSLSLWPATDHLFSTSPSFFSQGMQWEFSAGGMCCVCGWQRGGGGGRSALLGSALLSSAQDAGGQSLSKVLKVGALPPLSGSRLTHDWTRPSSDDRTPIPLGFVVSSNFCPGGFLFHFYFFRTTAGCTRTHVCNKTDCCCCCWSLSNVHLLRWEILNFNSQGTLKRFFSRSLSLSLLFSLSLCLCVSVPHAFGRELWYCLE